MEIWKNVKDYEGLYQVSNLGRVKRVSYNKILKPSCNKYGYLIVGLYKNGKSKSHYIHRLVANEFITNPNNLPCINHMDENKFNNTVENLEWCTHKYNSNYGTAAKRMGIKHRKKVIQISLSGKIINVWNSIIDAVKKTNTNYGDISACCKNKRKTAGGYIWKYLEVDNDKQQS